jgi:hypothetical protein
MKNTRLGDDLDEFGAWNWVLKWLRDGVTNFGLGLGFLEMEEVRMREEWFSFIKESQVASGLEETMC